METNYSFPGQISKYRGKVRDVYFIENDIIIIISTDRLSAFDKVMPRGIPYKGQILNQIATRMLAETSDIVSNWLSFSPDENVSIGKFCKPFKVEMVIRGYLSGHAARQYKKGYREICGENMPNGMIENDKFSSPIITPATKADEGHDEDISKEKIIKKGIVSEDDYNLIENYTYELFNRGSELAEKKGLILVDTKYEFGKTSDEKIILIDEIHTPDSSRYFYKDNYKDLQKKGLPQKQLSKEFVRQWLIEKNFQGFEDQVLPNMDDNIIKTISNRYIELYENITGENFDRGNLENIHNRIEKNLNKNYFN
jgi:phosphoribosylaminoimidazole-succinocarboxamide synthase